MNNDNTHDPGEGSSRGAAMADDMLNSLLQGTAGVDLDDYMQDNDDENDLFDPTWDTNDMQNNDNVDDDDDDEGSVYEDDEITQLLDSTKKARARLKTGDLGELAKDFEEFEDNLVATVRVGKRNRSVRRRGVRGSAPIPLEAQDMLGKANSLYISRDYGNAIDKLQEVITKYPNVHQAWNTLGLVHEEIGNTDRSLQLRMVAAHMNQKDASLWKELGVKSIETDATKQAIYCFTKALTVDPTDIDALWDRSFLYKKMDRIDDAIDGFKQILSITPHHFKVINELVQLYRARGMIKEAITLYEEAVEYHTNNSDAMQQQQQEEEEEDEFTNRLGYVEVNMLSELYLMQNDYRRTLQCIKDGVRHVQHRQHETSRWEADNDDEYFEENDNDDEGLQRAEFPIELRVRMGVCRLYLGDFKTAAKHFDYLLRYPSSVYPDLHQDIAYAYMDKRHYDSALSVFQKIIDASEEVEVDLLIRTADCYHAVGENETAAIFYVNVLEEQPENLDVMLSLATVYEEQGEEQRALELVDHVMKKNRELRKQQRKERLAKKAREIAAQEADTGSRKQQSKQASIFDETVTQAITKKESYKRAREERQRKEDDKEKDGQAIWAEIEELDPSIPNEIVGMDKNLMREYMKLAEQAYQDFVNTRAFFPHDRFKPYTGFYSMRRTTRAKVSRDREAQQMARRLRDRLNPGEEEIRAKAEGEREEEMDEEEAVIKEEEENDARLAAAKHFREVHFDRWLDMFIKYAYMLAQTRTADKAYDMLKRVSEANIFFNDKNYKLSLRLALLGCGLINDDDVVISECSRWFLSTLRFQREAYRLYGVGHRCGQKGLPAYANSNAVKYTLRNVRILDTLVARKNGETVDDHKRQIKKLSAAIDSGQVDPESMDQKSLQAFFSQLTTQDAKDVNDSKIQNAEIPDQMDPLLMTLLGEQMVYGRNFLSGSLFLLRSQAIHPNDPLTLLLLSIAFLNRAMNRRTENRHLQITQGLLFLQRYCMIKHQNQEAEYNLARALHLLGLTHLAVPHYERVLVMPSKANEGKIPEKSIESIYEFDEDEDIVDDDDDDSNLRRDAAYNLHLIYSTSGALNLAQIVLHKYIVI